MKLVAFDIDGTLAKVNERIPADVIDRIKELSKEAKVLVISGKPMGYVAGMVRQTGLKDIIISGSNGEQLAYGAEYPPKKYVYFEESLEIQSIVHDIVIKIKKKFGDKVWCQPYETQASIFHFMNEEVKIELEAYVNDMLENLPEARHFKTYFSNDCVDILPKDHSKGNVLALVAEMENIGIEDIISVGDGPNDRSMFKISGLSIGIDMAEEVKVNHRVENIYEALDIIEENVFLLKSVEI